MEMNYSVHHGMTLCVKREWAVHHLHGVEGGLNQPTDTISIYRWLSNDGYSWSLNPTLPVLNAVARNIL